MLDKLHDFFANKRVLLLGFGLEGQSTMRLLEKLNCAASVEIREQYHHSEPLPEDADIIMKSPGIPLYQNMNELDPRITGQADLFLRFYPNHRRTLIGVTGTKGKSTTSSLIHHILRECGMKSRLIGNIGVPPLDVAGDLEPDEYVVAELSCHQLEYCKSSPGIAVYLNLYEEHLDHYIDFVHYRAAKENIYKFQKHGDILIYGDSSAEGTPPPEGVNCFDTEGVTPDADKARLRGVHNLHNIAIAAKVATVAGIDINTALTAGYSFSGLEHRLEAFESGGIRWVNDSISTIPAAAIAAVEAFPETDTLIIGGMDRGIDYSTLVAFLNARPDIAVIALPDSGHTIVEQITTRANVRRVADMAEAVATSREITKRCCVLSPAAASYGFYKNFEERGRHFKELARKN